VSRIKTRVGKAKTKLAIVAKLQIGSQNRQIDVSSITQPELQSDAVVACNWSSWQSIGLVTPTWRVQRKFIDK